jgi:phosphatidate cytidylyltransferase
MLQTRLWMGALLIALTAGMLIVDRHLAPWFPFLFVFVLGLSLAACYELIQLLGPNRPVHSGLCYGGITALVVTSWLPVIIQEFWPTKVYEKYPNVLHYLGGPWLLILGAFAGLVLATIVVEMASFHEPGQSTERMGRTLFVLSYLGLLPVFLTQLRWLDDRFGELDKGTMALALAIFVPKCCDMGAYFTGRLLGRHKMTSVLSPKKTWEGAAGGLLAAAGVAIALDRLGSPALLGECLLCEIIFGVLVGAAGMLGDLAESLLKRDCQQKDASQALPGFGGVLDVVDAVIFAGPVAYGCLAWNA